MSLVLKSTIPKPKLGEETSMWNVWRGYGDTRDFDDLYFLGRRCSGSRWETCNWCFGWRDGEKMTCLLWKRMNVALCGRAAVVLGLVQLATVTWICLFFFWISCGKFQQLLRTKRFRRPHMRYEISRALEVLTDSFMSSWQKKKSEDMERLRMFSESSSLLSSMKANESILNL
jgi:hypothetical protein